MNQDKIKFAVIGCGHIGKRHAEMISRNEEAELVALIDVKSKDNLNLESFGETQFFTSINDFLNSDIANDVQVVNVATPNGFHAVQAIACLEKGKHVVIEKPMALSSADAQAVIDASEKAGKTVFCVMQNRYSPPSEWLKGIIDSGKLGKIFMVQLNCYWNRDDRYYKADSWHGDAKLDGGTLYTQFSHFIDLLYWMVGDISNVQSQLRNFNHEGLTELKEDSGMVQFDLQGGGIGCINFSTSVWNKNLESSLTIIAENGSIKVGGQYMDKVEVCNIKDYKMPILAPTNPGNDYGAYKGSAANHHYVIENVIGVLKEKVPITVKANEGLKVVEMIEKMYSNK